MSDTAAHTPGASTETAAYTVLARKYRPQNFDALIGQEAMVRVLRNAFETGRIHHAYVLTGVRGVGKTTTARIIAKGLNCVGVDGQGGPTVAPCGVCAQCVSITEGRALDVIEMDAASHTGVDYIRDLNETAHYRPASARYKVYIIDETHMLSTSAFNALLKTLEEPPAHLKFLFATTEIRKMPATVLSRCQRFDLRRIEPETLIAHLDGIAQTEGATIDAEALALIARAADGSVRDALSIMDQAIAHGSGGSTDAAAVRVMLGMADRGRAFDLLEHILRGRPAEAVADLRDQYNGGAEPGAILSEMAEAIHWISTRKIAAAEMDDPTLSIEARRRGAALCETLSMRALTRGWQMALKALEEVKTAPAPIMAAEMAVIRMCLISELPSPEELARGITSGGSPTSGGSGKASGASPPRGASTGVAVATRPSANGLQNMQPAAAQPQNAAHPQTFEALAAWLDDKREGTLAHSLRRYVRPISYAPGRLTFRPTDDAPASLAGTLQQKLGALTKTRWTVVVSDEEAAPTLAELAAAAVEDRAAQARRNPIVAAALAAFPGAEILSVRSLAAPAPDAPPPPDDDDDADDDAFYDPFGED